MRCRTGKGHDQGQGQGEGQGRRQRQRQHGSGLQNWLLSERYSKWRCAAPQASASEPLFPGWSIRGWRLEQLLASSSTYQMDRIAVCNRQPGLPSSRSAVVWSESAGEDNGAAWGK